MTFTTPRPTLLAAIFVVITASSARAISYNDGGIYDVATGTFDEVLISNGTTVEFSGASAAGDAYVSDTSSFTISDGMLGDLSVYVDDSAFFEFTGTADAPNDLAVYSHYISGTNSSINFSGGSVYDDLDIYSGPTLNYSGTTSYETEVYPGYYLDSSAPVTANFSGGSHEGFYIYTGGDDATGDITANFSGGTYTYAELYPGYYDDPNPMINISGGDWGELYIYNGGDDELTHAVVNVSGGTFDYTELYPGYYDDDTTTNITGGVFGEFYVYTGDDDEGVPEIAMNVSGGTFNGAVGFDLGYYGDGADVEISGGTFNDDVLIDAAYESIVTILGGEFNGALTINASAQSEVHIWGGQLGTDYSLVDEANATFYGYEFFLDGQPVPFGTIDLTSLGGEATLSGTLLDGSVFLDANLLQGGTGRFTLAIPEPQAVTLLLFAAVCRLGRPRF
ncbi:hypothetical protein MalM25_02740 [Planctomycetes bacterium MalM25]|nr:hypothetical protein MalM25_02740 [Planctomycetes bacterium MalM25]